jgi:hypothetical protein
MFWFFIFISFISIVIYSKKNKYIVLHKDYLKNEKEYLKYLQWCSSYNQIPLDKKIFSKEMEKKNSELKDILNN